jgi:hypothetical protein
MPVQLATTPESTGIMQEPTNRSSLEAGPDKQPVNARASDNALWLRSVNLLSISVWLNEAVTWSPLESLSDKIEVDIKVGL